MRKILALAVLILILSGSALAWTDDNALLFMDISRRAGDLSSNADYAKMLYGDHMISYQVYASAIKAANDQIDLYNMCLRTCFNASVYEDRKMPLYSLN